MAEFTICMRVDGRYTCTVDADDPTEAIKKATRLWSDADFGELEDIDANTVWYETNGARHDV